MIAVLDTHAIIWSLSDDKRLGSEARKLIASAETNELAISDISFLETAILIEKERIRIAGAPESFLRKIAESFCVVPIDPVVAQDAIALPLPQSDPFDRVITATARFKRATLITKDGPITVSGLVETCW